jgi:regulator of protease activity HflC (stomatin/prohibitin superfamily)
MLEMGLACGLIVYLASVAYRCAFRVDEGHLAVLVTFGKAETSDGKCKLVTYGPGLHAKKPWQRRQDRSGARLREH